MKMQNNVISDYKEHREKAGEGTGGETT